MSKHGGYATKGITPFLRKKENIEDKARITELTVIFDNDNIILEITRRKQSTNFVVEIGDSTT